MNNQNFHFPSFEEILLKNPMMATVKLARYKFVSKMLDKNDKIIDIGCGGGLSTFYYSNFCKQALGIDIDETRRNEWKTFKTKKINFICSDYKDIQKINYDANCIINVDFIEHLSKKEGELFIKNCKEFLSNQKNRRNKMLIIGTPSFYSKKYRAKHNLKNHKYEYKPDELYDLCSEHFSRILKFSMNDELVHTGFDKLSWFFFLICIS